MDPLRQTSRQRLQQSLRALTILRTLRRKARHHPRIVPLSAFPAETEILLPVDTHSEPGSRCSAYRIQKVALAVPIHGSFVLRGPGYDRLEEVSFRPNGVFRDVKESEDNPEDNRVDRLLQEVSEAELAEMKA